MNFLEKIFNTNQEMSILESIRHSSGCVKERLMNVFKPKEPC